MKIAKKLLTLLVSSMLYATAVNAAVVTDSVSIHAVDGSLLYSPTFAVPELKGSNTIIQTGNAYLDFKHRRFLQRCKALETDAALIYEAWKAGAAENESFNHKPNATAGKNTQNTGYSMSTDISESPAKGTFSFITKETTSIMGQNEAITYAATFDSRTGRRLSLAEAFGGDNAIADKIAVYIQHFLPISNYKDSLAPDFSAHVYDFCSAQVEDGWYIYGDYLAVIYPAASLTKNLTGELTISVPLKELERKQ